MTTRPTAIRWATALSATLLALTGCTSTNTTPTKPVSQKTAETTTLVLSGTVALKSTQFMWNSDTDLCWGTGGYGDLTIGAAVAVTDPAGIIVALGPITTGHVGDYDGNGVTALTCNLGFTVSNIPSGKSFYGVEVTHRGAVTYSEATLRNPITLTVS